MSREKCRWLGESGAITLRQRDDLFHLFVQRVNDYAIFLLDQDGCVISWNPGAEAFKGYRADEILGKSFELFYLEEDQQAGKPQRLLDKARRNGRVEDEGWRVRKDGRPFWADVVITSVTDEEGRHVGYAKITRDLTERRDAEERLRLANQELEQKVKERTAELLDKVRELQQFVDATVGRELKMVSLEQEVELLRQELNRLRHQRGLFTQFLPGRRRDVPFNILLKSGRAFRAFLRHVASHMVGSSAIVRQPSRPLL
jgi:PAS domain S-box-containing protein